MRPALLILALVALLRVPFLNQAIQGDDVYYLAAAQHAQVDPLHPHQARYVFQGTVVDMRGHPHPPLNAWLLAGVMAILGDIREVPLHATYVVFSLIAALAMWSLARRFSTRPLWATLLFLATPAFVVNGNSLEADVPFLAFWMAAFALWIRAVEERSAGVLLAAACAQALAAMAAYQAVVAIPILGYYLWLRARQWRAAWVALLTPALVIGAWQAYERASSGELPAAVLAGYFQSYGLQTLANKMRNAAALIAHAAWIVGPWLACPSIRRWIGWAASAAAAGAVAADAHPLFAISFGIGVFVIVGSWRRGDFLSAWIGLFFAAALALFFAGSARYLLPIAAPVAMLAANRCRPSRLAIGLALQLLLSLSLATVNYHHWGGYRDFIASLRREFAGRRVWINSELGLRYYAETEGGLPLERGQALYPGDVVITSRLGFPIEFTTGGGALAPLAEREIRTPIPLRLFALGSRSAWSTATLGFRPFDVGTGAIDLVRAQAVVERRPTLSWLPMNAPEAGSQIVSGVYNLEDGRWRWMGARAVILLKRPLVAAPLRVEFHIPAQSPARRLTLWLDGERVDERSFAPGTHTLATAPLAGATVVITADRTFSVAGDHRELAVVLSAVGFQP